MATKKNTKDTAVAKKGETAVALPFDYGDLAGQGLDLTMDDLLIPIVKLLQGDSKECIPEEKEKYIEGAEAGLLLNQATKDLNPELRLVCALRRKTFIEWMPDQGGFVAEHDPASEVVAQALRDAGGNKREMKTPEGNILQETQNLFAIVVDDDGNPVDFVVVPFDRSKLTIWRGFWTKINTTKGLRVAGKLRIPLYSIRLRLSVFNDLKKGKRFKNYVMAPDGDNVIESLLGPEDPGFVAAQELAGALMAGRAQADYTTADNSGAGDDGGSDKDGVF